MSKPRVIVACLAIVVTVGLPTFFISRDLRRASLVQPFQEQVVQFSAPATKKKARAAVRGKVLPVDLSTGRVDALLFDLPPSLRPATPAQVGTVLLLEWEPVRVGPNRVRYDCRISLVDARTRELLVDRHRLRGRVDRQVAPTASIIGLLEALPQL